MRIYGKECGKKLFTDKDLDQFRKYLVKSKAKKLFECPYLSVLTEETKLITDEREINYKKGSMLCIKSIGHVEEDTILNRAGKLYHNHRCHVSLKRELNLNEEGQLEQLEIKCGWDEKEFKLKFIEDYVK